MGTISRREREEGQTTLDPDHQGLLRDQAGGQQHVASFELFFALVFVFAAMQLSHRLLDDLTLGGTARTLLLLLVVWSAWVTTTWLTNWLNPDLLAVRLMLVGVMLASLFMSAAIPDAFGDRALVFAVAIVAIHVGRSGFAFLALRAWLGESHPLTRTYQRALAWHLAAGLFWIAGGLLDGRARYLLDGSASPMARQMPRPDPSVMRPGRCAHADAPRSRHAVAAICALPHAVAGIAAGPEPAPDGRQRRRGHMAAGGAANHRPRGRRDNRADHNRADHNRVHINLYVDD